MSKAPFRLSNVLQLAKPWLSGQCSCTANQHVTQQNQEPHLKVGVGSDIPVFPPSAGLAAAASGLLLQLLTRQPLPFLPCPLDSMMLRVTAATALIAAALRLKALSKTELSRVGTKPNFTPVKGLAREGVFSWSRNPMYLALIAPVLALPILLNSAWGLLGAAGLFWYLHSVVVPAEERFLALQLPEAFSEYARNTPRWFKIGAWSFF